MKWMIGRCMLFSVILLLLLMISAGSALPLENTAIQMSVIFDTTETGIISPWAPEKISGVEEWNVTLTVKNNLNLWLEIVPGIEKRGIILKSVECLASDWQEKAFGTAGKRLLPPKGEIKYNVTYTKADVPFYTEARFGEIPASLHIAKFLATLPVAGINQLDNPVAYLEFWDKVRDIKSIQQAASALKSGKISDAVTKLVSLLDEKNQIDMLRKAFGAFKIEIVKETLRDLLTAKKIVDSLNVLSSEITLAIQTHAGAKPISVSFVLKPQVTRTRYPKPRGLLNDFANVIPPPYENKILAITSELLKKTGTAVVVVTMPDIGGEDYNDYANRLYAAWGIGKKGEDKGVLIFVTIKERKMRIETGYGVEGILPDGLVGEIRDRYMTPYLKQNQFGEGLLNGTLAVSQVIAKDAGVKLNSLNELAKAEQQRREIEALREREAKTRIVAIRCLEEVKNYKSIPKPIRKVIFEESKFLDYITLDLPREDNSASFKKIESFTDGYLKIPPIHFSNADKIGAGALDVLKKHDFINLKECYLKSRYGDSRYKFLSYTEKIIPYVVEGFYRYKPPRNILTIEGFRIKLASRVLKSIDYKNNNKALGVYAIAFSYTFQKDFPYYDELQSSHPIEPHKLLSQPRKLPLLNKIYKGKAKAYLDPNNNLWKLEELTLDR